MCVCTCVCMRGGGGKGELMFIWGPKENAECPAQLFLALFLWDKVSLSLSNPPVSTPPFLVQCWATAVRGHTWLLPGWRFELRSSQNWATASFLLVCAATNQRLIKLAPYVSSRWKPSKRRKIEAGMPLRTSLRSQGFILTTLLG